MKRTFTLTILALLAFAMDVSAQDYRRWDFTKWSDVTVANLLADAAASKTEGWSDVEKQADADAGNGPTDTSKDNCFWASKTMEPTEEGELLANGQVIEELRGLIFQQPALAARNLAIAVNYPKALSDYYGPSYLWLGGAKKDYFLIPNVPAGTQIKMGVESHKASDARGVELYINSGDRTAIAHGTQLLDPDGNANALPTTYVEQTWVTPIDEGGDIIVYNTNGCHIYYIEVGEDTGEIVKRPVAMLYNGNLEADLTMTTLSGIPSLEVTPMEATTTMKAEDFADYDAVIVSSTVSDEVLTAMKDLRQFLPMLNLNPRAYALWECGETVDAGIPYATIANANSPLFKDLELIADPEDETGSTFVLPFSAEINFTGLKLAGLFANDAVLATAYQQPDIVAIHTHNIGHNGYIYLPYTQDVLTQATSTETIANAVTMLANSKAAITAAPKPAISLTYNKLNTDITLKSTVPSPQIFYTLDGSEPTLESTLYTEPINVTTECTVKAVALGDGYLLSEVAEMAVDLKDQADAPAIAVSEEDGKTVITLTASQEGAQIYFNLIGSDNKDRSQLYEEPFTLSTNALVAAFVEGDSALLRSPLATRQVNTTSVVYEEELAKFQGVWYNDVTNKVANGGYNYYTEEIIKTETLKNINGEDSLVNYYAQRDSMIVMSLSEDWQARTYGQGIYYTKATPEHKVANGSGYNPATVFDDQFSDGEITSNAMQFQVVKKTDGDGRLDPPSASLECLRPITGPFEVAVYYSGKAINNPRVLDIVVNTDTLKTDGWQKIGELSSVDRHYYDTSNADKTFRVWKRGAAYYEGTDPVFVRINAVENGNDVNIFTVVIKAKGEFNGIADVQKDDERTATADNYLYDLQGRRLTTTPQKGIYIKNGKKFFVK